jgi:hypothetical protein
MADLGGQGQSRQVGRCEGSRAGMMGVSRHEGRVGTRVGRQEKSRQA